MRHEEQGGGTGATGQAEVTLECADGVATVAIDVPDRRNALSATTMQQLTATLTELGGMPDVRAVVLTGNGAFCAGVDVTWLTSVPPAEIERRGVAFYDLPQGMIRSILALPVPVIAAVDGPAIGLGMDLALACDCRFIGPRGWFAQGWARAGLIPATGGAAMLAALSPGSIWRLLDADGRIDSGRASELNLAEPAAPAALDAARKRAEHFAAMPATMMRGYVSLTRSLLGRVWEQHLADAARIQLALFGEGRFRADLAAQLDS